jgi:hypothetical protein
MEEFDKAISELMIESPDSENPDLQHNAYNWGLAHAMLVYSGGSVEAIKATQPK